MILRNKWSFLHLPDSINKVLSPVFKNELFICVIDGVLPNWECEKAKNGILIPQFGETICLNGDITGICNDLEES